MKIGFVSLPFTGHLNPMATLARKMQTRGYEVVFIGIPDIESSIRSAGLIFAPHCEKEFPSGLPGKTSRIHLKAARIGSSAEYESTLNFQPRENSL